MSGYTVHAEDREGNVYPAVFTTTRKAEAIRVASAIADGGTSIGDKRVIVESDDTMIFAKEYRKS